MADHADDGGNNNNVFVYMGGDQEVPQDVTHVRIHNSVNFSIGWVFRWCSELVSIEMHDGVEVIEGQGFEYFSLRVINLPGVRVIGERAFHQCTALTAVDFGNKLERIERAAFSDCGSLRTVQLPNIRVIGKFAFYYCFNLTEVELSKDLETIGCGAFINCRRLRRITIPLKQNLLGEGVFDDCTNLSTVDLIGVHETISSLLLDSWRIEMNDEINSINQVLPITPAHEKTEVIRRWIARVCGRMEQYKSEHYPVLKENMTQVELALWKANLPNVGTASRHDARVTCGANIIIPHVLPFLNDADEFPLLDCDLAVLCINS